MSRSISILVRTTAFVLLTGTFAILQAYPFGILPDGANMGPAKRLYKEWKAEQCKSYTDDEGNPMLGTSWTNEYHGYSILLAAYCADSEEDLIKLYRFLLYLGAQTPSGLMPWKYSGTKGEAPGSAMDGNVDISIGLDKAARRWPNSSEDYKKHLVDEAYFLSAWSYNNWKLASWTVDGLGEPRTEKDPNGQTGRWSNGPARFSWRVAQHYLVSGDQRSKRWAERIIQVYSDGANVTPEQLEPKHIGTNYSADNGGKARGDLGTGGTTIGGAGICAMAAGNTHLVNSVWNWGKDRPLSGFHDIDHASHAICMLIMSGEFDTHDETPGNYPPAITVHSPKPGSIIEPSGESFKVDFDVDLTRQYADIASLTYYRKDASGSWEEITKKTGEPWGYTWNTTKGSHSVRLIARDVDGRESDPTDIGLLVGDKWEVRPYSGSLPEAGVGTLDIEAEHYDYGGQDVAYSDKTPEINTGVLVNESDFRGNEGVDIGGWGTDNDYVDWTKPGPEWTEYSFKALGGGTYDITLMLATDFSQTMLLEVAIDGEKVGSLEATSTGGWDLFKPFSISGVTIDAGNHVLRVTNVDGGTNVDKISITAKSVATVPSARLHLVSPGFIHLPQKDLILCGLPADHSRIIIADTQGRMHAMIRSDEARSGISTSPFASGLYFVMTHTNGRSEKIGTFTKY